MNFKKMLSIIMVAVLCLTLFSGCGEKDKNEVTTTTENTTLDPRKTVAMISGNESYGFYKNLKKGAEDAAKKYGYTLNYLGLDDTTDNIISSHISNIEKAINEDVSGVIIVPDGEGYNEIYGRLYDKKIPVVQIDNLTEDDFEKLESNKKNPIVSTVSTDFKEAGALCAEKLFEKIKGNVKKSESTFVIGVIERENSVSDEEKTSGFVEKFTELADADAEIKGKYKIETESESTVENSWTDLVHDNVKAVFITHPSIADKVADIVSSDAEKYKNIVFCGFDSGAKQLKWLGNDETAEFIGGFAQNSYDLGYNAVEQCIFSIQGKEVKENIEIQGKWYDKSNLDKMKQDNLVFEK